ncbi:transposase, partial [Patescibacteria group bacterium]|nr:transposase [Patescibacteria group bacterium]
VKERFSWAIKKGKYVYKSVFLQKENQLFRLICYCVMPDHYHLLVRILKEGTFSKYINDLENSYTRFFNIKFKRKGPLWQSAFKSVRIKNDEQLLHVTRYIHINPTTNNLVNRPEDWEFSSYKDYIKDGSLLTNLTEVSITNPDSYKRFIDNRINYQKKLRLIKRLILE